MKGMQIEREIKREKLERLVDEIYHNLLEEALKDERLSIFTDEQLSEYVTGLKRMTRTMKNRILKKMRNKKMTEKCFLCKEKFEDGDETIEFFGSYAHYACFDKQMKKNEEKKKDLLKNKNFSVIPLEKWDMPILTKRVPVPKKDDIPEFTELTDIKDDKEE